MSGERAKDWRTIAEKVLTCRECSFRRETRTMFHPDPGWGNLYAPIFVIGINGNWGVSRDRAPSNKSELRERITDRSFQHYDFVSRYWDWEKGAPNTETFFEINLSLPRVRRHPG
jgi:hypothetical protein